MNRLDELKKLKEIAAGCIKWNKDNGLKEKAIFLCKESGYYIYFVENKGNPFFGVFTKTGFKPIEKFNINFSNKNFSIIKEVLVKNLTYRLDLMDKRMQFLSTRSIELMAV